MTKITRASVLAKATQMDGFTAEEIEVINKMIASLNKKSGNTKPTKRQTENEEIKVRIAEFLATVDRATATEVGNAVDISCARATALLRQMGVPNTKEKGKSYYGYNLDEPADNPAEEIFIGEHHGGEQ